MELIPAVQNYDWGQPAGSSLVYKFAKNVADSELKFAELWMGLGNSLFFCLNF